MEKRVRTKRKLTAMQRQQERMAYLFITPALIFFSVFVVISIILALYLSMCNYSPVNIYRSELIWFDNYKNLFNDPANVYFWESLWHVLYYAVLEVPLVTIFSLLFAVLVNQKLPGAKVFRIIYYIPSITNGIAAAFVFQYIFEAADYGLINGIIGIFGGSPINFLGTDYLAMFCIVIISVWSGIGGNMIIYLAALQGVPPDILEAADIDGASKWQKFYYIVLPQITHATYFIVMMSLIGSFQLYDQVAIMTGGNAATGTPVFQIYMTSDYNHDGGLANAMAVILCIIIMIVTTVNNKIQDKINEKYA